LIGLLGSVTATICRLNRGETKRCPFNSERSIWPRTATWGSTVQKSLSRTSFKMALMESISRLGLRFTSSASAKLSMTPRRPCRRVGNTSFKAASPLNFMDGGHVCVGRPRHQEQVLLDDGFALEGQSPPRLVDDRHIELAERHRIDEVAAEAIRHRQVDLRMCRGKLQERVDQDALRDGRDYPEAYLPAQLASGFDDLFARPLETGHHRQEQAVQAATFGGWLHALRSAHEETLPHLRLELGDLHAECRLGRYAGGVPPASPNRPRKD
jgi:hypothetical protein